MWVFTMGIAIGPATALAQRPPIERPTNPDAVLEHLPSDYASLQTTRAAASTATQINRMMLAAARTGDARLATRAEKLIDRLPPAVLRSEGRKLRAFAMQHRHDFTGAIAELDTVIQRHPGDPEARYARAQIQLVRGRIDLARKDCAALALSIDASLGTLCLASIALRLGEERQALALVDRWLQAGNASASYRRHVLVLGAEAASRAGRTDADARFQQALALDVADVRTIAAYARHLRASGRPAAAVDLLARAPSTDILLAQHALAAHEARDPGAAALAARLDRRYIDARAAGAEPELRDEADYHLTLRNDAPKALALALENFKTQRDYEDVELLQRAAKAARRPDALHELQQWARSQQLVLENGAAGP